MPANQDSSIEEQARPSKGRELVALAWPIIGLNLLQVLAFAVDTAMVGRAVNSENSLIGLGYASQLAFLLMMAMIGLTVGTVATMARAHGAKEHVRAQAAFQQSLQLTLVLGALVALLGNILAKPLLTMLGADDASMGPALDYLRPILLGTVLGYLVMVFAASMRALGNTRIAFLVSLAMNALNAFFNYGLILGNWGLPAWGNFGAAIGTLCAQGIAVVLMVIVIRRAAVPGLTLHFRYFPIDFGLVRNIVRIGWPAAVDMLVLNISLMLTVALLGRIDQAAVGAHSVGLRVQLLAFVPGIAISQAIGALVGQALGAGRVEDARAVLRAGVILCLGIMMSLGAVLYIFATPIVGIFVDANSTIGILALEWMHLLAYMMPASAVAIATGGLFQGAGATMISLKINAMTSFGLLMPCAYLLGFVADWGAVGVWAAFPISSVLRASWNSYAYFTAKWAEPR